MRATAPAAQDRTSLGGKILRVTTDGRPAPGNPFPGSRVWSLGHRNVQGLAWDSAGRLYASEFGQDTLGRAQPHQARGQLRLAGGRGHGPAGPASPTRCVQWPTDDASPSGIAMGCDGDVYVAALRGAAVAGAASRAAAPGRRASCSTAPTAGCATVATRAGRPALGDHQQHRPAARPAADDDRVIILPPSVGSAG